MTTVAIITNEFVWAVAEAAHVSATWLCQDLSGSGPISIDGVRDCIESLARALQDDGDAALEVAVCITQSTNRELLEVFIKKAIEMLAPSSPSATPAQLEELLS